MPLVEHEYPPIRKADIRSTLNGVYLSRQEVAAPDVLEIRSAAEVCRVD